jgi:hypothetical protein
LLLASPIFLATFSGARFSQHFLRINANEVSPARACEKALVPTMHLSRIVGAVLAFEPLGICKNKLCLAH